MWCVAVDVIVRLVASGCTPTSGGGDGTRIPRDGAGAGKCRPGAESGGDTSPQLRRMRQRSVKMARGLLIHIPEPIRTSVTWAELFYESLGVQPLSPTVADADLAALASGLSLAQLLNTICLTRHGHISTTVLMLFLFPAPWTSASFRPTSCPWYLLPLLPLFFLSKDVSR